MAVLVAIAISASAATTCNDAAGKYPWTVVGEKCLTHPVHPMHPTHPTHPMHPTHPVHPTHPQSPSWPSSVVSWPMN